MPVNPSVHAPGVRNRVRTEIEPGLRRLETNEMAEVLDEPGMRRVLHIMLQLALIEIRASDSIANSAKIANVFHNLPLALLGCSTAEDHEAKMDELMLRAQRTGLLDYVRGLRLVGEREVANSPGPPAG